MATYGENFRRFRGKLSQEVVARRLKLKRQANVSAIELGKRIPSVPTILKHAAALSVLPSALLKDVPIEHQRMKDGEYDNHVPRKDAIRQSGVSELHAHTDAHTGSAAQRDGRLLAVGRDQTGKTDSVPHTAAPTTRGRRVLASLVSEVRAHEEKHNAPASARTTRQPTSAARVRAARSGVRDRKFGR